VAVVVVPLFSVYLPNAMRNLFVHLIYGRDAKNTRQQQQRRRRPEEAVLRKTNALHLSQKGEGGLGKGGGHPTPTLRTPSLRRHLRITSGPTTEKCQIQARDPICDASYGTLKEIQQNYLSLAVKIRQIFKLNG